MEFTVEEGGISEAIQHLVGIRSRAERGMGADGAGPALSFEIAGIARAWFEGEGYGTWPPLSPSTQAERARQGYGAAHPILVRTGRLKESLGDPRGRGARDSLVIMSPSLLVQGTLVPYAIHHKRGTSRMPARSPLELRAQDDARLRETYARYIMDG